jgi:hypothetical protein
LDCWGGVGIEIGQPLQAGEAGFGDPSGAAAAGAFVDFGGEGLGEEREVALAFPDGDLGESGCSARMVGRCSSRAAAPIEACAAVSVMVMWCSR